MVEVSIVLVVLVILDGWGYCLDICVNVIVQVNIFIMDSLIVVYFNILVNILGKDVGLFKG